MSSQPAPSGNGREVLPFVIRELTQSSDWESHSLQKDLFHRAEVGEKKYGTRLKTDNGRDAMQDAYEEAQDAVMYLAQAVLEEPFSEARRGAYATARKLALLLAGERGTI